MSKDYSFDVPTWNGDPATFHTFETACRWYEKTLKEGERRGAAARVWSRLTGPARSVVKHLSPEDFDNSAGLDKLLLVLRSSPLQTLPIPDSFSKLERWHSLRRKDTETIPELIVREDDLFRELQQSLLRSRAGKQEVLEGALPAATETPKSAAAASPSSAKEKKETAGDDGEDAAPQEEQATAAPPLLVRPAAQSVGFFEDELRGYRLLKAAGLNNDQRMQILTLTSNSVAFEKIRQALRALFGDAEEAKQHAIRPHRRRGIWWTDEAAWNPSSGWGEEEAWLMEEGWGEWAWDEEAHWASPEWAAASWHDWDSERYSEAPAIEASADAEADDGEGQEDEEALMAQEQDAAILAAEATKTLAEARAAISRVRAARGYYPLGGKKGGSPAGGGKGSKAGKSKGKSFGKFGGKPGTSSSGPGCLICGSGSHFFRDCPQRFKGGPGKGKGTGKAYWAEPVYSIYWGQAGASEDLDDLYAIHSEVRQVFYDPGQPLETETATDHPEVYYQRPSGGDDYEALCFAGDLVLEQNLGTPIYEPEPEELADYQFSFGVFDAVGLSQEPPAVEHALVISLEAAYLMATTGSPGFVLDTGATESAVGVRTLQAILEKTKARHTVSRLHRPLFKFGDGLSLRASSRVTLYGTALGEISFFVLDGDSRPQTHQAENTPALIGSRFLKQAKANISYEHMCLWFRDSQERLWGTELLETQSGHLQIPVQGELTDLSGLRQQAESRYQIALPPDAPTLLALLATPGALAELKKSQGKLEKYTVRVQDSMCDSCGCCCLGLLGMNNRLHDARFSVHVADPPADSNLSAVSEHSVFALHREQQSVLRPSLPQRLGNLALRLAQLRLRAPHGNLAREGSSSLRRSSPSRLAVFRSSPSRSAAPQPVQPVAGLRPMWAAAALRGSLGRARQGQDCGSLGGRGDPGDGGSPGDRGREQRHRGHGEGQDLGAAGASAAEGRQGGASDLHGGARPNLWRRPSQAEGDRGEGRGDQTGRDPQEASDAQGERRARGGGQRHRAPGGAGRDCRAGDKDEGLEGQASASAGNEERCILLKSGRERAGGDWQRPAEQHERDELQVKDEAEAGQVLGPGVERPANEDEFLDPAVKGLPSRSKGFTSASRRALHAAGVTYFTTLLCTTTTLLNSIQAAEFWEINGNSPQGHFGPMSAEMGITYQGFANDFGHDLAKKNVAKEVIAELYVKTPAFAWIAPHVRGPLLQDGIVNSISPLQWRNHLRAQRRCKDVAYVLAQGACAQMDGGRHFAWEWPMDLKYGWDCEATRLIFDRGRALGLDLYDFVVHGCAYHRNPEVHGKKWRIITSSPSLATALRGKRCPGHKEHPATPRGRAPLPLQMCSDSLEGILWELRGQGRSLREDVETWASGGDFVGEAAYTLGRPTALPPEAPTGKRLQQVKDMMLRVHKASGHTSMENLSRLLLRRGAPEWAVSMAKELSCPDCAEAKRKVGPPQASLDEPAGLWEVLGLDVFEYEHVVESQPVKSKFLLMIDRGSRFTMVAFLKTYRAAENWEPSSQDIKSAIVRVWLNANPSPKWLLTDAAAYFTSREMLEFCSHSGLGLLTSPAEAHWVMGIEERTIQILKRTAERLEKEDLDLSVSSLFSLAAQAHNARIHPATGYSPFQWARGWSRDNSLPIGLDPKKAFGRSLLLRTKAEEAFVKADSAIKLSKLKNTVSKAVGEYKPGSLAMLWRQRVRHGHGGWTGPLRVLLQEGTTVWLATGSTLVRAKLNQLRPSTEREQLIVSTQGATLHKTAVGLDTLLKGYRGKHFLDASSESPGDELEENLEPAEVRAEPSPVGPRPERDTWERRPGMLVRIHNVMRLSLFSPSRVTSLPVSEDQLTGNRRTIIKGPNGPRMIVDNFRTDPRPSRALMERWHGETQFELKPPEGEGSVPAASGELPPAPGERQASRQPERLASPEERPASLPERVASPQERPASLPVRGPASQVPEPPVPEPQRSQEPPAVVTDELMEPETPFPQRRGPEVVAGSPLDEQEVTLPPQPEGLEEEHASAAPYSTSEESDSSDELVPEGSESKKRRVERQAGSEEASFLGFACEISFEEKDLRKLTKKPRKAAVWLSQKMSEKSREVNWRQLSLEEKREYDEAQAIEVTNVVREAALRALTAQELCELEWGKVMSMRWVLTRKSDGRAKARVSST